MRKILLTSTGFTNKNIEKKFLELLDKDPKEAKALFIITAAIEPDAVRILSGCLDDLTDCGFIDENIKICNLHEKLSIEDLKDIDAIYVCGGSTRYLISRMNEVNFKEVLEEYLEQGGIYVGVSAGSVCAGGKYPNNLAIMSNIIDAHCENGSPNGPVASEDPINLTDNQAIYISDSEAIIFE